MKHKCSLCQNTSKKDLYEMFDEGWLWVTFALDEDDFQEKKSYEMFFCPDHKEKFKKKVSDWLDKIHKYKSGGPVGICAKCGAGAEHRSRFRFFGGEWTVLLVAESRVPPKTEDLSFCGKCTKEYLKFINGWVEDEDK